MKRTSRPVKCTKVLGNRGTGTIHDSCRFDIGRFRAEPTTHERCLHPSDTFAYRSADNNLFLTLHVFHKLKMAFYSHANISNRIFLLSSLKKKTFPYATELEYCDLMVMSTFIRSLETI